MKNTSTVLETSIPFHTLVHLVDAEGTPDDKIRAHDFTHGVIYITKQLQTQTLDSSQNYQLMFTQSHGPNNKTNSAYEKYCYHYHSTNHSLSAEFER